MPDDENDPEGVNLGQERYNSAWEGIIRPGPGNPGLARPEQFSEGGPAGILRNPAWGRPARHRPAGEIPARPDAPDPAQPGAVEEAQPGWRSRPSWEKERWALDGGRRPKAGRRCKAQLGQLARPSRDAEASPAGDGRSPGPAG
jgi:hypothetical protein